MRKHFHALLEPFHFPELHLERSHRPFSDFSADAAWPTFSQFLEPVLAPICVPRGITVDPSGPR